MGKILRCKDIGVDCDFVARGKTEGEVLKKASEHAKKDHNIKKVTKDYLDSWRKHISSAS
jgi:predicted small metal-binding protein